MKMNKLCGCGSGLKYKRCCWRKAIDDRLDGIAKEEEARKKRAEARASGEQPESYRPGMDTLAMMTIMSAGWVPPHKRWR